MTSALQKSSAFEKTIANRYRLPGYEVIEEPGPNLIPFDLKGYRPDFLARRENVNLMVKVKAGSQRISY